MASLTVAEIMTTKVRTLSVDDTISSADLEMFAVEIHHLLIVNARGQLVGIISDRDILRARRPAGATAVGMIMSCPPISVSPSMPVADAVERMLEAKINALPVVDEMGRPVGIVTSVDFLEVARWVLYGLDARAAHVRGQRSSS